MDSVLTHKVDAAGFSPQCEGSQFGSPGGTGHVLPPPDTALGAGPLTSPDRCTGLASARSVSGRHSRLLDSSSSSMPPFSSARQRSFLNCCVGRYTSYS